MYLGNIVQYEIQNKKLKKLKIAENFVINIEIFNNYKFKNLVPVNIIPRFYSLFFKQKILRSYTENVFLHFLGYLDLFSYTGKMMLYRLMDSHFSKVFAVGKMSNIFSTNQLFTLFHLYILMKEEKKQEFFYLKAIVAIFPNASIYYSTADNLYIICTLCKKTDDNVTQFNIITSIFFDISQKYEVYWGTHIGIIGIEEYMNIGKIQLF